MFFEVLDLLNSTGFLKAFKYTGWCIDLFDNWIKHVEKFIKYIKQLKYHFTKHNYSTEVQTKSQNFVIFVI